MILGIDTQILIFAGLAPTSSNEENPELTDLRTRAKLLIYKAADQKHSIVIPTLVVTEVLVPVPPSQRGTLIQSLEKRFLCPPFDIRAATIAADLWSKFRSSHKGHASIRERAVLRADALIVASAYAANATHFYSHDKQCRAFAELVGMTALDLPVATELSDQFLIADIRNGTVPDTTVPDAGAAELPCKRTRKKSR